MGKLGYAQTRQKGSHIRLTTTLGGEHHITIPDHDSLKYGTLRGILTAVADHHALSLSELVERLDL